MQFRELNNISIAFQVFPGDPGVFWDIFEWGKLFVPFMQLKIENFFQLHQPDPKLGNFSVYPRQEFFTQDVLSVLYLDKDMLLAYFCAQTGNISFDLAWILSRQSHPDAGKVSKLERLLTASGIDLQLVHVEQSWFL